MNDQQGIKSEFEPVRAEQLRKGDTVRRTKKSRTYTITEISERDTMHGTRVHVTSGDVHFQSDSTALWWRQK